MSAPWEEDDAKIAPWEKDNTTVAPWEDSVSDEKKSMGDILHPKRESSSKLLELYKETKEQAYGAGEAIATTVGGAVAGLPVMTKQLYDLTFTKKTKAESRKSAEELSKFLEPLVYQPKTERGKQFTGAVGYLYDLFIGKPSVTIGAAVKGGSEFLSSMESKRKEGTDWQIKEVERLKAGRAEYLDKIDEITRIIAELGLNTIVFKAIKSIKSKKPQFKLTENSIEEFNAMLREQAGEKKYQEFVSKLDTLNKQKALPAVGETTPTVVPSEGAPKPVTYKGQVLATPEQELKFRTTAEMNTLPPQNALPKVGSPARVETAGGPKPITDKGQVLATDKQGLEFRTQPQPPVTNPMAIEASKAKPVTPEGQVLRSGEAAEATQIAKGLGIEYNGTNTHKGTVRHFFTDSEGTGTTFVVNDISEKGIRDRLLLKRQEFVNAEKLSGSSEFTAPVSKLQFQSSQVEQGVLSSRGRIDAFKKALSEKKSEIKELGIRDINEPLIVLKEGEGYRVVEGNHRLQAYKELGITDIPVVEISQAQYDRGFSQFLKEFRNSSLKDSQKFYDVKLRQALKTEIDNTPLHEQPLTPKEKSLLDLLRDEEGALHISNLGGDLKRAGVWLKEYFSQFSTLKGGQQYLKGRYERMGALNVVDRKVAQWKKSLDQFDIETRKNIFRSIGEKFIDRKTGEELLPGEVTLEKVRSGEIIKGPRIPIDSLPPKAQEVARKLQKVGESLGKAAVLRGEISADTFELHRGSYVPYIIGKHTLDKYGSPSTLKKMGGWTKERLAELSYEDRIGLGLIEDASISIPYGYGKLLADMIKHDRFLTLVKNPDWVMPERVINIGGKNWTYLDLVREVDIQKELVKRIDEPLVRDRLVVLETALKSAEKSIPDFDPKLWEQMPDVPGYGPLAGRIVRKSIADDIRAFLPNVVGREGGDFVRTVSSIHQRGVAVYKIGKVAMNPPTMVTNATTNLTLNYMRSGATPVKTLRGYSEAIKGMRANDKLFREARRYGAFETNWSVGEMNEIYKIFNTVEGEGWATALKTVKKVTDAYGNIDNLHKLYIYREMRTKGFSIEKSILEAQKWGMDYTLVPPSIKYLRKSWVPFISFYYKAASLTAETIRYNPHRVAVLMSIPRVVSMVSRELNNISDEEWKRLLNQLPEVMRDNRSISVLPWQDEKGKWQWINVEKYLPWANFTAAIRSMYRGRFSDILDLFGSNPFVDLYTVFKMQGQGKPPVDPFTGQEIYSVLDSPTTQYLKIMEFVWNKWEPSAFSRKGAAGITYNAWREKSQDAWGNVPSAGQAMTSWLGVNIYKSDSRRATAGRKAFERDLLIQLNKKLKDKRYSSEEKRDFRKRYNELRRKGKAPLKLPDISREQEESKAPWED